MTKRISRISVLCKAATYHTWLHREVPGYFAARTLPGGHVASIAILAPPARSVSNQQGRAPSVVKSTNLATLYNAAHQCDSHDVCASVKVATAEFTWRHNMALMSRHRMHRKWHWNGAWKSSADQVAKCQPKLRSKNAINLLVDSFKPRMTTF